MINLSITLQTHPKRSDLARALARKLDCEMSVDPDPLGFPSPWRTYRHALETTPADATHRLVLQDDVTPCEGLREAVEAAIAARPHRLLCFFVGGHPHEHASDLWAAAEQGWSWVELDNQRWCPAIALCWPTCYIDPLLRFVDAQNWPESFRADDEIIGRFCRWCPTFPLASVPSLVQHEDIVPSLVGQKASGGLDSGRVAACWIGDCDPATIDWTLGPGDE